MNASPAERSLAAPTLSPSERSLAAPDDRLRRAFAGSVRQVRASLAAPHGVFEVGSFLANHEHESEIPDIQNEEIEHG